jgi:hypothetical protein
MENVARYINGLKFNIRDEINLLSPRTIEEAYQLALKAKEKLSRKQTQHPRDKSSYFRDKRQHDDNNSIQVYEGRERIPPSQTQSPREGHSYKRRTSHSEGKR